MQADPVKVLVRIVDVACRCTCAAGAKGYDCRVCRYRPVRLRSRRSGSNSKCCKACQSSARDQPEVPVVLSRLSVRRRLVEAAAASTAAGAFACSAGQHEAVIRGRAALHDEHVRVHTPSNPCLRDSFFLMEIGASSADGLAVFPWFQRLTKGGGI